MLELGGIGLGLILLIVGGEFLVRGASSAAEKLGVSPLVIGLTLVAFGTSAPEMAISVYAVYAGSPGIALGNIVGSNISNILLILGVAALIMPIPVPAKTLHREGTAVLLATALFVVLAFITPLDRTVGLTFLGLLIAFLLFVWLQDRNDEPELAVAAEGATDAGAARNPSGAASAGSSSGAILLSIGLALLGIIIVVAGGRILVDNAIALARSLDIAEEIIGLTIVALGTSMPELVTCAVAAFRRETDILLGSIVGSNLFNLFAIGGVTGALSPGPVPYPDHILRSDNIIMLGVTVALIVIAWSGRRISRGEGAVLLISYIAYIAYLTLPELDKLQV